MIKMVVHTADLVTYFSAGRAPGYANEKRPLSVIVEGRPAARGLSAMLSIAQCHFSVPQMMGRIIVFQW
jgi:hypothetical protein